MITLFKKNYEDYKQIKWENVLPEKLERCVADVKKQGGVDNPWAVCKASLNEDNNQSIEETVNKQIIEASLQRKCGCQKKKG